ncbi:Pycsar system effector family protein [Lewinella sp. IMCC34183]|uniref:Pycsar system effector family protein n=1 Tax=Lewinella sp. IMCC34183 TaxID=2248762 RepID=UPI000E22BA60|nr:Pycsar system effector family protein [Lewinella sp. IMCC34183]
MNPGRFSALHLSNLADQAERFMLMTYERLPRALVLHNDSWALSLAGHSLEIALRRPGVSPDLPHLARTAALLEACRYWGAGSELRNVKEVAQEFRDWTGPDYLNLQLTLATVLPDGSSALRTEVADVLYDAQLAQRLLSGPEGAELMWLENRYALDSGQGPRRRMNRTDALAHYLDELRQARFRDGELRRRYQHTHSAVLLDLQKLVDRLEKKKPGLLPAGGDSPDGVVLQGLEKGPTRQATQTYFRTIFRNHIQLKRMADQKAAIMVSVNALLIGALITFVTYRNWAQTRPEILLPVVVFIICALASLVYAIVASRPHGRRGEENNLAFYGTISKMKREEFTRRMESTLLDPDALYGNLISDLHGLGGAIDRKYRLLKIAYNIFLMGLVISVLLIAAIIFLF